jgi:HK97 family phage prohead protease
VVLFAHDYRSLPIGRVVDIAVTRTAIVMVIEFATAEMNPVAEQVLRLVRGEFLNATSIGFRPLRWAYNEERRGVDFFEVDLLEISVVPVPCNAEALVAAGRSGADVRMLRAWAHRTLAATEASGDDVVLELVEDDTAAGPAEERLSVDTQEVRALVGSALHEELTAMVARELRAALNAAAGRVD